MWATPGSNVFVTEEPSGGAIATTNNEFFGNPFAPKTFDWIRSATLTNDKPVQFEGKECLHYSGTITEAIDLGGGKFGQVSIPCEAWVDSKTLFPVMVIRGMTIANFIFGQPPTELEMPEKLRKRLEYYKVVMGG